MPPPSKSWVVIADSQVDADSPLDSVLMTGIRDDLVHLEEWVGLDYTAAQNHDHDDVNSKAVVGVADAAISQAKLSTTTGEVSTTVNAFVSLTLPGGSYGFYPQIKMLNTATGYDVRFIEGTSESGWTSYVTNIALKSNPSNNDIYAQQRYIQASPPYMLGDTEWGHFLFLLRRLGTGEVVSTYQAEDPPWAYNGLLYLPKDHVDRIAEVPHPFADYWDRDAVTDGLEIVLVNLSGIDVATWRNDNQRIGRSILEDLGSVLTGRGISRTWNDYTVPTIDRFTDRVKVITP